ncbi:ABC transporter G family member 21 [Choanephora cucurbitarum]|uniref:ABC transporter G family member 21 n=1 Tax=Choanephora cucurbitarum TaxID=101091 RepID=A0A1C7NHP0_9FUNG|nr:ABC transporter G family member 21 [Choanephora cucurbitarum]
MSLPNQPHRNSVDSDGNTIAERDEKYVPLAQVHSRGGYGEADGNAVDIENAIEEYRSLERELTRQSLAASRNNQDTEKGQGFDLTEFLSDQHSQLTSAGLKPKNMGVIWKNLSAYGLSAEARSIRTNVSAFTDALQFWNWGRKKGTDVTIIHEVDGFVKSGEMLLVLGRPGAGCSTLLRILANIRSGYTNITGEVTYGGIDALEFGKYFKGEVGYNEEEDVHYPTLTTEQTLRFALKNKTPSTRLPGETRKDFVNKILYMLGNMLGLTKQMHTKVGNAFVRGLSGGERKRLSIAEQMTTHSSINCWDCSTRGLDASSALDYVRSLRIMTDIMHKTTISTLYQASDNIFELFDKVMVLDESRCIYFGPTSEAKQYFVDMGFHCPSRKSTPDFLTGLCNLNEREIQEGYESKVPLNAAQFEKVYKESEMYKEMMAQRQAYEEEICKDKPYETFKQAFQQAHSSSPIYSYYQQVKSLTVREYQLIQGDIMSLIIRFADVIVKGLITASVFYMMPLDGTGAFSRSGAILFIVLIIAFIAQGELPTFMEGRGILQKHKRFAMYHPSALYIAQVIIDFPLAILQSIVFTLCVYFIMGLALDAGKFFFMFINLVFLTLCVNGFFRFWGAISPNFYIASQVSGILFIALVMYTGYQIPYPRMHPWLMWIYWINPLAYNFKALLSSEMTGAAFSCEGPNAVPYGPSYTEQAYRACVLPGGNPGDEYVLGDNYLKFVYDYDTWQKWIDFVAVALFFVLFTALTALSMEYVEYNQGGSITKVYKKGFSPIEETEESQLKQTTKHEEQDMEAVSDGTTFSWHNINYTVPVKGGTRQLLDNVSGIVKPGHLTALMGSSGAGKTTLLDVLARRKTIGKIEGQIYMNGEHLASDFERLTGYCEQMDVHNPNATVREALQFSAYLRQPADIPKEEKDAYVEQIIDLLEMKKIGDALVGDLSTGTGISVEERKRLTIAIELVGKPKLLFLDEPTSGLDAQSSFNIIRFIRKLADAGWPVLCTIHQPSATLFEHFDHLILLVRGGKTAYFGEIGKDSRTMIDYFESNNGPICSPKANPAEYILECVGAGTASNNTQDWAEIWKNSPQAKALEDELNEIDRSMDHTVKRQVKTYALPFWSQLFLVFKRMNTSWWRAPSYNVGRMLNLTFIALIAGFTFFQIGNTSWDMQNRMFAILVTMFSGNLFIILIQARFMEERLWFRREYASRYYSWGPFALSCVLVEFPYIVTSAALFLVIYYWTVGFTNASDRAGYFFLHFIAYLSHSVSSGYAIAAACESMSLPGIINPVYLTILYNFTGLFTPPSAMPRFWSSWMYWLDPYHYFIEGLVTNALDGVKVECGNDDVIKIKSPPGQTCGQYMSEYFASGGLGYVTNPDSTDYCNYCQYSTGNEYYETRIGWSFSNRWRNFGILWIFTAFNICLFVLFTYLLRKPKR